MTQLHYATAHTEIDLHTNDEHAYRFKPAAWRFVWLWWNLVLLGAAVVLVLVALSGDVTWATLTDTLGSTALQIAPLALALSILIAQGKVDLSLPLQTTAATYLLQWLAWMMDFNNAQHVAVAIVLVVLAMSLVGLVNWCLCTLLRAPSAIVTLMVGGVASMAAIAIGARWDWSSYRPGPIQGFIDVVKVLLRWSPLAATLVVVTLLAAWLVVRRSSPPALTQARRECGAELVGFVLASVVCALTAVAIAFNVSPNAYVSPRVGFAAYNLESVFAAVLIGGTLFAGKVVNPLGAILGSAIVAMSALLASQWYSPGAVLEYRMTLVQAGVIGAAAACVVLGYSKRIRSLLAASCDDPERARPVSFLVICAAAAALVALIGAILLLPLINVTPDMPSLLAGRRVRSDGTPIARVTLCLAVIGASATFLLLSLADLLMTWRIRVRK